MTFIFNQNNEAMENKNTSGEGLLDLLPIIRILGMSTCYSTALGDCELIAYPNNPDSSSLEIVLGETSVTLDRYGRIFVWGEPLIRPQGNDWKGLINDEGVYECFYIPYKDGDFTTPVRGYARGGKIFDCDGTQVEGQKVSEHVMLMLEDGYVTPEEIGLAKPPTAASADKSFEDKLSKTDGAFMDDSVDGGLRARLDGLDDKLESLARIQRYATAMFNAIKETNEVVTKSARLLVELHSTVVGGDQGVNDSASGEPKTDGGEGEKVTITPEYEKSYLEGPVRVWVDKLSGTAERELMLKLESINLDPENSVELIAISTLNSIDTKGPHWSGRIAWRTAKGASTYILTDRLKRLVYLYRGGEVSTTQFIEAWLRIVEECEELPGTCFRRGVRIGGDEPKTDGGEKNSAIFMIDEGDGPRVVNIPGLIGVPSRLVEGPVRDWLYSMDEQQASILKKELCASTVVSEEALIDRTILALSRSRGVTLQNFEMADCYPRDVSLWISRIKAKADTMIGGSKRVIEMWLRALEECEKEPGKCFANRVSPERLA